MNKYFFLVSILFVSSITSAQQLHRKTLKLMGSRFDISVLANDSIEAINYINLATDEISRIEKLISSYEPAEVLAIFELSEILEEDLFTVFDAYDSNKRNWKAFFTKNRITKNQYNHLINQGT